MAPSTWRRPRGRRGKNVTVAELAGDIGATQLAEISRMQDLLG
ncbi:hypothetical protein [uncultured Nocardioides sp.]|nr:hypothetical protein [uncultured Nocardioides sp.]